MDTLERIRDTLEEIREAGLYKEERIITTAQNVEIKVQGGSEVLNFCANNYLGLADNAEVIAAAHKALDNHGFGLASVRFMETAAPRTCTSSWSKPFPGSSAPKTPYFILPASMQTAACSKPSWVRKML